jgi:hypothetical protein
MSLAMFSISCMLILFTQSCLSFLHLAFSEFRLLELCRLTLFKFRIKVLRTKRKPNSPLSWAIDPYKESNFHVIVFSYESNTRDVMGRVSRSRAPSTWPPPPLPTGYWPPPPLAGHPSQSSSTPSQTHLWVRDSSCRGHL